MPPSLPGCLHSLQLSNHSSIFCLHRWSCSGHSSGTQSLLFCDWPSKHPCATTRISIPALLHGKHLPIIPSWGYPMLWVSRWQGISIRGPSHLPSVIDMAAKTTLVTCILISIQHETSAGIALCLDNCVQLSQLSFSHGCTILCPHPNYKRASFPPPPRGHRLLSVFTTAIPVGVKWISL